MLPRTVAVILLVAMQVESSDARAQSPRDAMVQPPTFRQPERGSLVGGLAKLAIGAEDVSRGSYTIPLPVVVPSERAPLLGQVLPSYAPENGISEWGVGWAAGLSIQRFRLTGDVDYQTDGFTSPWGRLARGDDGFYYPVGLKDAVKLERRSDRWVAISPSGMRTTFLQKVNTPEGPYAWYATKVETLLGDVTEIEYVTSTGGRPFVSKVRYGSIESPQTYRVDFEYQTLPLALVDYRSGYPLTLDRRVKGMVAHAKEGGRGTLRRRWRYDFTYRDAEFGPGFFLDSVMRTYVSDEIEPPTIYEYDLPEEASADWVAYRTGDLEDAPGVQGYLDATGDPSGLESEWATSTDLDEDGLADLEHGIDFTLFQQTAAGTFVAQPLPPPPPGVDTACRAPDSVFNQARALVRMAGVGSALQVLVLEEGSSSTEIKVCTREGVPQVSVNVPGLWHLDANMKVADLNRDDKPDLILVDGDSYEVLENTSGQGCPGPTCVALGFTDHAARPLAFASGFPFTPTGTWVHDINGDGNPDLILRSSDRMSIWYGQGRFVFADQEVQLAFVDRLGSEIFNLGAWEVAWVDANKDGLTDALMTIQGQSALFINEVDRFQEVVAPLLEQANQSGLGAVLVGDYRGRGDLDLNFVPMSGAAAADLTSPSTGLLVSADDGKGTVVSFAYQRTPAVTGLRQRPAILRSLTVATAGYDDAQYTYTYGGPTLHSVGHFVVGFNTVTVKGPLTKEIVDFHHDDDIAGQIETTRSSDTRTAGIMKVSRTVYEEARHADVRVRRPQSTRSGWCKGTSVAACIAGTSPAALELTENLIYERGVCATKTRKTDGHGQLEVVTTLASPSGLSGALHCLAGGETWTGTHPANPTRDFRHETRLTLNDLGQPTKVEQLVGAETLTLQEVTYDSVTRRVKTVSAPGQGLQSLTFDANSGQLKSATGTDGVTASAQNREHLSDALKELVADRGTEGVLTSSFRYDAMERLAQRWTDFGGSSQQRPLETLLYEFPNADLPAFVRASSLVDAAAGTRMETATWSYPDGEPFAAATQVPGGWVFDGVTNRSRAELRTRGYRRSPLADTIDPALATYATLRAQTTFLSERLAGGFGHLVSGRKVMQQGVEGRVTNVFSLENGLVITTHTENDELQTRKASDASGRLVSLRDEAGGVTQLAYDALGRLVAVNFPDGASQRLTFDGFGRPAKVERDQVGDVTYVYKAVSGLLDHKDYRDSDGVLERTVTLEYDGIGRVTARVHRKTSSGAETRFTYRHDGDVGGEEVVAGQKGYTTQVEGEAYTATTLRYPDGSERSTKLALGDWMQVDIANTYNAGGLPKESHRVITRPSDGEVIEDVTIGYFYDAFGRLDHQTVNGANLATLHYDSEGRVAWVDLPGGQRIDHSYDPTTSLQAGYSEQIKEGTTTLQAGTAWGYNNRGLVAHEVMTLGGQSWDRAYWYDPRGFLSRSEDREQLATYTHTAAGLPDQIVDSMGARTVFRGTARTISVGGIPFVYDASGRVKSRANASFSYGPDGQLGSATIGSRTVSYQYDADGNRLLKLEGGVPVAGFVAGGYLTHDTFIVPVKLGGRLVGVLENGVFHQVAADPRGTILADRDGTPRLPTPYGVRATRPDLSPALDYVEKGYDADLGTVRMGVRDYDPLLGQFWSPDPLFLEAIDKSAESPVDGNLFSYARNNPIGLVDPNGQNPIATALEGAELGSVGGPWGMAAGAAVGFAAGLAGLALLDHITDGPEAEPVPRISPAMRLMPRFDPRLLPKTQIDPIPPIASTPGPSQESPERRRPQGEVFLDTGGLTALAQFRPDAIAAVNQRRLVTCQTAWAEVNSRRGLSHAGPLEKVGLNMLAMFIQIQPDSPSARVMALTNSGAISKSDQHIFGTADQLRMQIITGDGRFVSAARHHGVNLDTIVLVPAPRWKGQ